MTTMNARLSWAARVSFAVVALPIFVPSLAPKSSFRERLGLCWELCRTRLIRMREGS